MNILSLKTENMRIIFIAVCSEVFRIFTPDRRSMQHSSGRKTAIKNRPRSGAEKMPGSGGQKRSEFFQRDNVGEHSPVVIVAGYLKNQVAVHVEAYGACTGAGRDGGEVPGYVLQFVGGDGATACGVRNLSIWSGRVADGMNHIRFHLQIPL